MPLAVREQPPAGLGQREAVANRGQRVLQGAAAADVHVDIAAGHPRQAEALAHHPQAGEFGVVIRSAQQLDRDPQSAGEMLGQPARRVTAVRRRQPQAEQSGESGGKRVEVCPQRAVAALLGAAAGAGDQPAQRLIALEVGDQQHDAAGRFGVGLDREFAANDQPDGVALGGLMGADDAGQRAFVGDGECAITQRGGTGKQLVRLRGPALEAEGRPAVQLDVVGPDWVCGRGVPGFRCIRGK